MARIFRIDFHINRCSSLCELNFWLNREEIKQFWSKILKFFVISLRSRLNRDHIEAWVIMNYCKNWPKSPFEHRMHVEEETEEIHFNPRDLKPNFHINQVVSVVWS